MKEKLKKILKKSGWFVRKSKNLQHGVELGLDVEKFCETSDIHVTYDVGAHYGKLSRYFSNVFRNTKVYAFEPVLETFNTLRRGTSDNPNITAFNYAFSDSDGSCRIVLDEDNDQLNSLANAVGEHAADNLTTETIQVRKLDSFAHDHSHSMIDFLKIDTEGYEIDVLKGAVSYLESNRIMFIFAEASLREVDPQHTLLPDLVEFLEAYRFNLAGIYDQVVFEKSFLGYFNALFVHDEAFNLVRKS